MNHLIDALIGIVSCLVAAEIWSHKDNVARWLNPEGRWLGPVDRWLISKAVERLPADARGRFCEEWLAHLDETPGTLRKLLHAVGCYLAAAQLAGLLAGQTGPEAQFTFMPAAGWFEQKRLQKDFKYFEAKAKECAAREGIEVDLVVYKQARLLWPVISRGLSYEDRRKILDNLYVNLRACNQKRAINHDTRTREEP